MTGPLADPDGRVVLRQFQPADVPDLVAACNDELVARFLWTLPYPYTEEHARWWVRAGAPAAVRAGGWSAAIADPADDRLLGGVALTVLSAAHRTGTIGYWVAPWARGRGVATAATRAMSGWASGRGTGRLELAVDRANLASQRVALAAGFGFEGVRRGSAVDRAGQRHDQLIFARLAGDADGPVPRLLPDLPGGGVPGGRLSDGVVALRPLGPADADDLYALHNRPEVLRVSFPGTPVPRDGIAARCADAGSHWLTGARAELTIRDAVSDAFAGDLGVFRIDPGTGTAMIGYNLAPAWRGRGYATRAVRLVAGWALGAAGLHRLIAGTAPDNVGSQRVLERAGFRREGYQRGALPGRPDGGAARADDVLYGLVRADLSGT